MAGTVRVCTNRNCTNYMRDVGQGEVACPLCASDLQDVFEGELKKRKAAKDKQFANARKAIKEAEEKSDEQDKSKEAEEKSDEAPDLESMSKPQLLVLANRMEVGGNLGKKSPVKEIKEAIKKKLEENAKGESSKDKNPE